MSLRAMLWVMNDAPAKNHAELAILYALAERADDQGRCSWPSQEWIADRARCSVRTVRRHLVAMEERGLIYRGDQRYVAHIRKDRRPIVWTVNLRAVRDVSPVMEDVEPTGQPDPPPNRPTGQNGRPENRQRQDTDGHTTGHSGSHDRTLVVERPDTAVSYKPSLTVQNQEQNQPPVVPQGGRDDEPGTEIIESSETTPAAPGDGHTTSAGKQKRGTRLDPSFFPEEQTINNVRQRFPGMSPAFMEYEHEKFHDHWAQASGRTATKRDWDAAWRNWMRTAVDRLRPAERAAMFGHGPTPHPQAPAAPSKAEQYYAAGADVEAEFAPGGEGL